MNRIFNLRVATGFVVLFSLMVGTANACDRVKIANNIVAWCWQDAADRPLKVTPDRIVTWINAGVAAFAGTSDPAIESGNVYINNEFSRNANQGKRHKELVNGIYVAVMEWDSEKLDEILTSCQSHNLSETVQQEWYTSCPGDEKLRAARHVVACMAPNKVASEKPNRGRAEDGTVNGAMIAFNSLNPQIQGACSDADITSPWQYSASLKSTDW